MASPPFEAAPSRERETERETERERERDLIINRRVHMGIEPMLPGTLRDLGDIQWTRSTAPYFELSVGQG